MSRDDQPDLINAIPEGVDAMPRRHPAEVHALHPRRDASFLDRLKTLQGALLVVVSLVGLGAGGAGYLGISSAAKTNAEQDAKLVELDEDTTVLFEAKVEQNTRLNALEKKIDWGNQALWESIRGREDRVKPPPSPSPSPTETP